MWDSHIVSSSFVFCFFYVHSIHVFSLIFFHFYSTYHAYTATAFAYCTKKTLSLSSISIYNRSIAFGPLLRCAYVWNGLFFFSSFISMSSFFFIPDERNFSFFLFLIFCVCRLFATFVYLRLVIIIVGRIEYISALNHKHIQA